MTGEERPVAVLLAGGLARRFGGGDKALCLFRGRPLLAHVVERMRPQARALVLNANGDPSRFAAWGLPVVADPLPGNPGPLAGVLAGMLWTRTNFPDCRFVLSVPTDTPFLPPNLAARLGAAGGLACAASAGRLHPVVAVWPVALADRLAADLAAGARKVGVWAGRAGAVEVEFPSDPVDPFFNVNRPDDLRSAAC